MIIENLMKFAQDKFRKEELKPFALDPLSELLKDFNDTSKLKEFLIKSEANVYYIRYTYHILAIDSINM